MKATNKWVWIFIGLVLGVLLASMCGCSDPAGMRACGNMCANQGVKEYRWNGQCICRETTDK